MVFLHFLVTSNILIFFFFQKLGDSNKPEIEYFLFLYENKLSSRDDRDVDHKMKKITLIKEQLIREQIDEKKVVYVLYGWMGGPSFERMKPNVPWKGEIVVMLKHNLEVHFGPTFSSFFANNFYRSRKESNDDP
jgi:hypothetical protein